MIREELGESMYRSWKAGLCPCCSGPLVEYPDWAADRNGAGLYRDAIVQPADIAEGVVFCGRCIAQKHDSIECDGETLGMVVCRVLVEFANRPKSI